MSGDGISSEPREFEIIFHELSYKFLSEKKNYDKIQISIWNVVYVHNIKIADIILRCIVKFAEQAEDEIGVKIFLINFYEILLFTGNTSLTA